MVELVEKLKDFSFSADVPGSEWADRPSERGIRASIREVIGIMIPNSVLEDFAGEIRLGVTRKFECPSAGGN